MAIAGEVAAKLALGLHQDRMFMTFAQAAESNPTRVIIFPNDCAKTSLTGDKIESSDR